MDNAITTLPMSYVYGLSVINTHLKNGGSITLNNSSLIQKNFWEKMHKNKVTNFAGVPYTSDSLIMTLELPITKLACFNNVRKFWNLIDGKILNFSFVFTLFISSIIISEPGSLFG